MFWKILGKAGQTASLPVSQIWSSQPSGRSAWNSQWKIVIPGNTLLSDPNLGIQTFINTVKDIKLHLETYSYSGN